jgi:hypothetical protein
MKKKGRYLARLTIVVGKETTGGSLLCGATPAGRIPIICLFGLS